MLLGLLGWAARDQLRLVGCPCWLVTGPPPAATSCCSDPWWRSPDPGQTGKAEQIAKTPVKQAGEAAQEVGQSASPGVTAQSLYAGSTQTWQVGNSWEYGTWESGEPDGGNSGNPKRNPWERREAGNNGLPGVGGHLVGQAWMSAGRGSNLCRHFWRPEAVDDVGQSWATWRAGRGKVVNIRSACREFLRLVHSSCHNRDRAMRRRQRAIGDAGHRLRAPTTTSGLSSEFEALTNSL